MGAATLFSAVTPAARAEDAPPASDAALQQRIELLERQTATLKGRLAALEAAQRRLDTRPSLEACAEFGALARSVGLDADVLSTRYGDLAALAERYPDRRDTAHAGSGALRVLRDELLAHAVVVVGGCEALGMRTEAIADAEPTPVPVGEGTATLAAGGSVVFWSGVNVEALSQPGGGLKIGRMVAGALVDLPEVLWVRVEGVATDRIGLEASFLPGESGAGRSLLGQFVASSSGLRGVVLLPLDGPLSETWALAGLARAFDRAASNGAGDCAPALRERPRADAGLDAAASGAAPVRFSATERAQFGLAEVAGGQVVGFSSAAATASGSSATCGDGRRSPPGDAGPSVALVVVTRREPTPERVAEIIGDWRRFVAPAPDLDPTTSNFFEASGGFACRPARVRPRPGGCTQGVPDLP
jgi:hypothetical protein